MRYEVPQFIDIEDKLFGPFSFKQAVYVIGGGGGAFAIFRILTMLFPWMPIPLVLTVAVLPLAFGAALAFVKINRRPFIKFLEAYLRYLMGSKRYIWKKSARKKQTIKQKRQEPQPMSVNQEYVPKINRSKLKDLALSLDMEDFDS